jgi:hypothetical protein
MERRDRVGSGWLPPSQGWGGLRDEDAPGTGDTQGSGPSDARVVFVTARCRDDGASVCVHWYLTLQKQLCKKAKKSCRGFPQKLFFQKKEQIWSCMGKQCKMCFLGYGQFFFSGMDRV